MTTPSRYANGHARRKVRAWLKAQGRPCWLCGGPIDYSLPAGHPMSFEVDEIVPVSRGGSPIDRANVQPAHRICNQMKGNRLGFTLEAPGVPHGQVKDDSSSCSPAPSGSSGPLMFVDSDDWV